MSIRLYLLVLFIIFLISGFSVVLLLFYMNPIPNPQLAFLLLGIGSFLMISSFLTLFLYFIKKIYYRGDVNLGTMNSSLRQGILISIGGVFLGLLMIYKIQEGHIIFTTLATLGCIEVMFQAID